MRKLGSLLLLASIVLIGFGGFKFLQNQNNTNNTSTTKEEDNSYYEDGRYHNEYGWFYDKEMLLKRPYKELNGNAKMSYQMNYCANLIYDSGIYKTFDKKEDRYYITLKDLLKIKKCTKLVRFVEDNNHPCDEEKTIEYFDEKILHDGKHFTAHTECDSKWGIIINGEEDYQ